MISLKSFSKQFFSVKIFGMVLGLIIYVSILFIGHFFNLWESLENRMMDVHFNLKSSLVRESRQENVVTEKRSHKISRDIIIVGIDNRTLDALGRWPFPRTYHANLLNSFTRIKNQNERESAILLDILFNEVGSRAFEDVILIDAIKENGHVALQSQLTAPMSNSVEEEYNERLQALIDNYGEIQNIQGDLSLVVPYYGIESPLIPYGRAVKSFGHASFSEDIDQLYRRQQLVTRYSKKIGEISIKDLNIDTDKKLASNTYLGWIDKQNIIHLVDLPLTDSSIRDVRQNLPRSGNPRIDSNGQPNWYLSIYEDHFLPAITLSLALEYFHKTLDDIEVVYGSHILIENPNRWDPEKGQWVPYSIPTGQPGRLKVLSEIKIPIDDNGNMLINFMGQRSSAQAGGAQTFPVRSYSAYASSAPGLDPESWPKTKKLGGKVIMVGAFSLGMADDEKNTPVGLMFGVEMHTNALNTIIMNNFITKPPQWVNQIILIAVIALVAFMTSHMKSLGWSVIIVLAFLGGSFLLVTMLFSNNNILFDWATPAISFVTIYFTVLIYRVLSAEKDKRQIKDIFGQFISPAIVEELSSEPPELGGADMDITVFFSDIRGFSKISEQLTAQELVLLLNEYLTEMTNNLVNTYDGTLDKYIGDAIMAFWGAPRVQEDHAVRACKCAVSQIRILRKINERLEKEGNSQKLDIGIGLNSGKCMVGYMGSEGRKNYTIMGDVVNLASRLEGVNKTYQTQIIISDDTIAKINHEPFIVRELDQIRVKGRNTPVSIYELIDYDGEL